MDQLEPRVPVSSLEKVNRCLGGILWGGRSALGVIELWVACGPRHSDRRGTPPLGDPATSFPTEAPRGLREELVRMLGLCHRWGPPAARQAEPVGKESLKDWPV